MPREIQTDDREEIKLPARLIVRMDDWLRRLSPQRREAYIEKVHHRLAAGYVSPTDAALLLAAGGVARR